MLAALVATMPFGTSFWIDEAVTVWITEGSLGEALGRALTYQGQSPLYFFIVWFVRYLPMPLEWSLRITSLVGLSVALCGVWAILNDRRDSDGSWWAVLFLLSLSSIAVVALGARPYMLAIAAVVWSFLFFQRWVDNGSQVDQVLFIVFTVIGFYLHYLFIGILAVELAWWFAYRPRRTALGIKRARIELVGSSACIAALCVPGVFQLLQLMWRAQDLTFAAPPAIEQLAEFLFPSLWVITCVSTWLIACRRSPNLRASTSAVLRRPTFLCLVGWHIIPPLLFYFWSSLGGANLFVHRYFLWHIVGGALLCGLVMAELMSRRVRLLSLGLFLILFLIQASGRHWIIEDWRSASRQLASTAQPALTLVYTGLIEAERGSWLRSIDHRAYLLAPLSVYPVPGPALPLPASITAARHDGFLNEELLPAIQSHGHVNLVASDKTLITADGRELSASTTLRRYLERLGLMMTKETRHGGVIVFEFIKSREDAGQL